MSDFIPMPTDFEEIEEVKPLAGGLYALRIESAELRRTENGEPKLAKSGEMMFNIRIGFEDQPDAPSIFHNLMMPVQDSKPFTKVMTKKFLELFGIDPYTIDIEGQCFLGASNPNVKVKYVAAGQYPEKNELDL